MNIAYDDGLANSKMLYVNLMIIILCIQTDCVVDNYVQCNIPEVGWNHPISLSRNTNTHKRNGNRVQYIQHTQYIDQSRCRVEKHYEKQDILNHADGQMRKESNS